MQTATTILLSVFSGALTAALLFVLGRLFQKVFIPWYQRIIYKGIDLIGDWVHDHVENEGYSHFQANLNQNAHNITGTMIYIRKKDGGETRILYNITGSVWEGYVTLNFESPDRKRVAFATALLKVTQGGSKLIGNFAYHNFNKDEVETFLLSLERKSDR